MSSLKYFLVLTLIVLFSVCSQAETTQDPGPTPPGSLLVRGDNNFAPFEFTGRTGEAQGFTVDLLRAALRGTDVNVDISLGPWRDVRSELEQGRIDLLTGVLYSRDRDKTFDFTIPHSGLSYSIFVRKGSPIKTQEDLRGKSVIVHDRALAHDVLTSKGIAGTLVKASSSEEAVKLLAEGRHDCAVLIRLNGLETLRKLKIDSVHSVGPPIMSARYGFAVKEGDKELLAFLNDRMYTLYQSGEYDRICRKWFSVYENRLLNYSVLRYAGFGLASVGVIVILVFIWNIALRRAVDKRTLALNESERRFRELAELLPQPVFETDADGRLMFFNQSGCRLFGYDSVSSCGNTLTRFFSEQSREGLSLTLRTMGPGVPAGPFEYTALKKDGTEFPVFLYASMVMRNETVLGIRGLLVDISPIRDLENQIERTRKMEALGRLAGGIAHDFNNLLTGISGYVQLAIKRLDKNSRPHENLTLALDGCRRASSLVKHITTFSRQSRVAGATADTALIAEEVVKLLSHILPAGVTIFRTVTTDETSVGIDPTQLHQVLMNLCINASHAIGKKHGSIEILVEGSDTAAVRLSVRDTGEGIPEDIQEKIFEPYFSTKDADSGTGLGLSVVKSIIETAGGSITVDSRPGQGATFAMCLPKPSARPDACGVVDHPEKSPRVLIAGDDPSLSETGKSSLEPLGFTVDIETDGIKAMERFHTNPNAYGLVITDRFLTGMNGTDLAAKLYEVKPGLPVILCTGYSDDTSDMGHTESIAATLRKPLVRDNLTEAVKNLLKDKTLNTADLAG